MKTIKIPISCPKSFNLNIACSECGYKKETCPFITKVVNINKESCGVYIGRGSPFGNPFKISLPLYPREVVIKMYRKIFKRWLKVKPEFKEAVLALRGKRLG